MTAQVGGAFVVPGNVERPGALRGNPLAPEPNPATCLARPSHPYLVHIRLRRQSSMRPNSENPIFSDRLAR